MTAKHFFRHLGVWADRLVVVLIFGALGWIVWILSIDENEPSGPRTSQTEQIYEQVRQDPAFGTPGTYTRQAIDEMCRVEGGNPAWEREEFHCILP